MKTAKYIILGFIIAFALSSCDNMVGLGEKLDLDGPEVNFTSPPSRKTIQSEFWLEGTVSDYRSISQMLIKANKNGEDIPRQWRNIDGRWEISDNYGASWSPFTQATWEGSALIVWKIYVDLKINDVLPEDGEYMFSVQAWDKGGISDDNSYKTLILIIDTDPPKVTVFDPVLYDRSINYDPDTQKFDNADLEKLRGLTDWRDPELIGKFMTSSFLLQWSIEDNFNIWSFDLRFYDMSVPVDNKPDTPLSDDYIYRFHQNTPPPPDVPSPESYLKPNGSVTIPNLSDPVGTSYDQGGELKKPLTDKTIIRVVSVCYDAANNVTQEKTLGYLIYWPQADTPWITFSSDDLKSPQFYDSGDFSKNIENAFLIYPGRDIKAIAFHAQGVKEVTFSLYKLVPASTYDSSERTKIPEYDGIKKENPPRGNNNAYSTNFSWGFRPPPRSAFYVVEAKASSISGKECDFAEVVFKVQDITFPDFPVPIQPPELEPLFKHISSDSITISGIVDDATEIDTLCLVWINPQSKNAAANAQLEYFRDQGYAGWKQALKLAPGETGLETANVPLYGDKYPYDPSKPNRFWKLQITKSDDHTDGINPLTQRVEYKFSKTIPLSDLNIGINNQPLSSQVFLLRAENTNPRVTIITYTPQGDEAPPEIIIKNVIINTGAPLTPGAFGQINKLNKEDKITINGTWGEDSVGNLPFDTYLKNNFKVSINSTELTTITFPSTSPEKSSGTWQAIATVKDTGPFSGNDIPLAKLKDTLVVAANLSDIGGNKADDGASWLIESDALRLVRISSEAADQAYNALKTVRIFLEFNKPVNLKEGRSNPVLTLRVGNNSSTATYEPKNTQDTRQYFTYTVANGQNTNGSYPYIDVIGLNGLEAGNYWEKSYYPFTWEAVSATSKDEIRITMEPSHTSANNSEYKPSANEKALLRRLPVAANPPDLPYTLAKGKNISVDTQAPNIATNNGISSSNKAGHYRLGDVIDINVKFDEPVKIVSESNPPQLILQLNNKTVETAGIPKVNDAVVTFSYTVGSGDTTRDDKLRISSFTGGQITDIAGTNKAPYTFTVVNGTLNGGSSNSGDGIYINTVAPEVPTFRALKSSNSTDIISNTITVSSVTSTVTGESDSITGTSKDLKNYYGDNLYFAVIPNTTGGNNRLGYLEYTLDGTSWKRIDSTNGTPFKQDIYGAYNVRTRQIDKAGNISPISASVSLNWDPGELVTRIDSSTPNGTYTNNTSRNDKINITVYFRKQLNINGTPSITLNAIRGTGSTKVAVTGSAVNDTQLPFTYNIANNDNTPGSTKLDVDALSITATDSAGVNVNAFISLPADAENRLGTRKDIKVQTGALALSSTNPAYSFTAANDEATGTITLTFNREISKRSGEITVTQQSAGYRLPAVLTETQANRYKSIAGFNTYYTKGTNGAENGVPDTSTKYVLNYGETAVVTPDNSTGIAKLAYDFQQAEKVTLPVSSQDVTVSGNKLIINLTGSNALQVLGAAYDIVIPVGLVQDSLGFQSPAISYNGTGGNAATTPGINRPFVRVDKKVNADRIVPTTGDNTSPYLMANFSGVIQTRARLDCRTPGSVVRYKAAGAEHEAKEVDSSQGIFQNNGNPYTGATYNFKNTKDNADENNLNKVAQQNVAEKGQDGDDYTNFSVHISVGTNNYTDTNSRENLAGYVWRIGVRSRNGINGLNDSAQYEEIAFRTVLTYEVNGFTNTTQGQIIGNGDQIWIRGGDAPGSSSVSGFPLNWQDDYGKLNMDGKRAGIRLLRRVSVNNNMNNESYWRWVTWEVNVRTWFDIVLAHNVSSTTPNANEAWQYGPMQWAYQRAGWTAVKEAYTMYPGKHRWLRNRNTNYDSGTVNFSSQFFTRAAQGVTYTQPNP